MTNRHDAMGRRRRIAGRLTSGLVRTGLPSRLIRDTVTLDPGLGVDGDPEASAIAYMSREIGGSATVAITLGPRRYNRKPVVQIMDERGRSLAFAKLACDPATVSFVANEAAWLARATGARHSVMRVPDVIEAGDWRGKSLLTATAVSPTGHAPECLDQARLVALAADVVSLGPVEACAVRDAPFLETVATTAAAANDKALASAVDAVRDSFGGRSVLVGPWHGDFSPWNMLSTDQVTWLIDWEFAADSLPVGVDLLHNQVMVATHLNGISISHALAGLAATAPMLLTAVERALPDAAGSSDNTAALAFYLLELRRRDAMLASISAPTTGFGEAALEALSDLTTHKPGTPRPGSN